jgi:hypothetical protein
MSKMIANLLEGQPFCNQSGSAGMSQTVWTVMGGLDTQRLQPVGDYVVQAAQRKRAKR